MATTVAAAHSQVATNDDSQASSTERGSKPNVLTVSHGDDHIQLEKAATRPDIHDVSQAHPTLLRTTTSGTTGPPFSIFTSTQKKFIVFMASWAGFFSPVSANIYLPALNPLASSLNVSSSLINLTLTSYMVFQGLAPAFVGSLADNMGRRPAYTVCFIVYIAANVGLALQNSYAALMVLRCVQSSGSSATIAMASAVVADVSTPAERGSYMGFTLAGSLLGPAIGPVLGGVLAQFLGWRAIFWFLVILAVAFLTIFLVFFPETARSKVGNGSIPPEGWNMSLMNYLAIRRIRREQMSDDHTPANTETTESLPKSKKRFPNPLASLVLLLDKQVAIILLYNALLFCAFYDVTATIPSQFAKIFHFNDLQIGLCFIPFGVGSMLAALVNGQFLDRNFARWCRKLDIQIKKGRDMDLRNFPIERARLEIAMPAIYTTIALILVWGWLLEINGPLPALLVILFFTSFSMSIAFNVTSTLLVDFYPTKPATATAANNFVRCLLGAGATAAVLPMIEAMGRGWTFTFLSLVLLVTSPLVWLNFRYGMKWREERRMKEEMKARMSVVEDGGESMSGKVKLGGEKDADAQKREQPVVEGGAPELAAVMKGDHGNGRDGKKM
ncbi:hypothetical protein LTR05_005251 [Lithohypha guttulata]|uniref:Major facilitator superfamily (MFS) profile domain-containing protein n=1 Tax=Lithohypha guttulata TaxID=1690604 RepID=A0AAN7Y6Y2_9EURO|nr:hypothetical protein LTR05_005251 [Lithohypha guttulata]